MLIIVALLSALFGPLIIQYYFDKSKKENKERLQRKGIFSVYGGVLLILALHASGVLIEESQQRSDFSSTEVSNEIKIVEKVTLSQAEAFMRNWCNDIGQTLMRSKTVDFDGHTLYVFMSVAENGMVCISSISEHKLEVLAADCGESQMKINEWNNL